VSKGKDFAESWPRVQIMRLGQDDKCNATLGSPTTPSVAELQPPPLAHVCPSTRFEIPSNTVFMAVFRVTLFFVTPKESVVVDNNRYV
jgi:hypothetical protein